MMLKRTLILLVGLTLLVGCEPSPPTVDTSSDQAMEASLQAVRDALPPERRPALDTALQVLVFSDLNPKELLVNGNPIETAAELERALKSHLQGRTGEEIIAMADEVVAQRKARECQQMQGELAELTRQRSEAVAAREQLTAFEVTRSRFYMDDSNRFMSQPVIELSVKNGTDSPISRAYFAGTLASPDRAVPWLQKEFNYQIAGGLEPGEEARWRLAPNAFEWRDLGADEAAVFTVTVKRLDGPDGEKLYPTIEFTERDERRLNNLQERLARNCGA